MKPCAKNQKPIAWLAIDALDVREANALRAHLETCEGCRRYWEEISNLTQRLTAAELKPDLRPSESFHQKVMSRLRAEASVPVWENVVALLHANLLNWRVALPVVAAVVLLFAALPTFLRRPDVPAPAPAPAISPVAATTEIPSDLPPTIANYQWVANQSLDKLDDLLTRQGNRNPMPTRIYTASSFAAENAAD